MAALSAVFAGLGTTGAKAQLVINPTFDSTITSDANSAQIEGTINQAIGFYHNLIQNPISVNITFSEMGSGLGRSSWWWYSESYSAYRSALASQPSSAVKTIALAHLPNTTNDPVLGNSQVAVIGSLAHALGFSVGNDQYGIGLNTSICFYDHSNPVSGKYDLYSVVCHEIDEDLGFGSTVGGLTGNLGGRVLPEDLFRYDANGNRSYQTLTPAFFSIDGTTKIAAFNYDGAGDYGDWKTGAAAAQTQDAYVTSGIAINPGVSELTLLDAMGYTMAPAPEPASMVALGIGAIALLRRRRR